MRKLIPQFVIGALADVMPSWESHASLDSLFMYANAPGDPPEGSKPVKVQEWLRRTNKDPSVEPLEVLGRIVEKYLEEDVDSGLAAEHAQRRNDKIKRALQRGGLQYVGEGVVTSIDSSQVRSLEAEIRKLNVEAIDYEFKRAVENVSKNPYEAVSAACNILESIFKVIIEERRIPMPKVQDLPGLWKVTKKELGFEAADLKDQDLLQILSGLSAIISGVGALRTHTSSAHGRGKFRYTLEERHVLLAIHSAHSIALFVIQTWKQHRS